MKKIRILYFIKSALFSFLILTSFLISANEKSKIIAGPYLIAPTSSGMTVMWETSKPEKSSISISGVNKNTQKENIAMYNGTKCPSAPEGINLYKKVFTDLNPDTKYNYTVNISSGENISGHFKTLQKNPKDIRFFIISDTHNFETAPKLTKVILKEMPEFIVHTGDMVLGTGYSKPEFNKYWFNKGREFLKNIPVIYAPGNHDHGPFFEDYFTKPQSEIYNSDSTGNNVSFNYGNIHFIIMDSNSWGLLKMGAVKAGLPVSQEIRKLVTNTKNWLINDLKSKASKKADWRLLFMHHPYVDDMTRAEIVPIAEKYGVSVLFAGHKHKYFKNVSIDPEIANKTVYINLPTALQHESMIDFEKGGTPPVSGFPEISATGLGDFAIATLKKDVLNLEICSLNSSSAKKYKILDSIDIVPSDKKQIYYSNIEIMTETINAGENITLCAEAKNNSKGIAAVSLDIFDNGEKINKYVIGENKKAKIVILKPGESKKLTIKIPIYKTGSHKIQFNHVEKEVYVKPTVSKIIYKDIKIVKPDPKNSNIVLISVNVYNMGSKPIKATIPFYVNNKLSAEKEIEIESFETKKIKFSNIFTDSGIYSVKIGNTPELKIRIYGTVSGTPYLIDKSNHNNNGLIRGNPKLVESPYGKALLLDGKNDYIEIPDSDSFRFKDGWSGIVLAEPIRIVPAEEKDHNPLLQKGPSIGWGPNYTVRMALRRTGLMTWGTSTGTDEFFWDGGKYPLNKWSFYIATFNKKRGGRGYIDNNLVAKTPVYGKSGPIQNWIGYPLFCGFSYIGHVDQRIHRAAQHTMFNGKIGEIRFYNKGLDTQEIKEINNDNNNLKTKCTNLITWLNPSKIETSGTYISEWRRPIDFTPSYKGEKEIWSWNTFTAGVKIPGESNISGRIQISDDGKLVKDSMSFTLKDGRNKIDISNLQKAQFIRMKANLTSNFTINKTAEIPELDNITIEASRRGNRTIIKCSTKADWQNGTFKGAVGFLPEGRFEEKGLTGADFYH